MSVVGLMGRIVVALFGLCASVVYAQSTFPPLVKWTEAVATGSTQAVRPFYSSNPPAVIVVGREQSREPDQDAAYWAGLKADGITGVHAKVLSVEKKTDAAGHELTILVTRVYAQKFGQTLVSAVNQYWTEQPDGWRMVAIQRSPLVPDNGRRLPEPAKPNTALYASPAESVVEYKEDLARAGREHKRVLVMFGANWCYDCHVLDTTFHSKEFAPLLEKNYIVAHINIGDEGHDNNDLAQRLGVNIEGVPALAIVDPNGKVVTAQQNKEFSSTTRIGPDEVRAFLEKYKPTH